MATRFAQRLPQILFWHLPALLLCCASLGCAVSTTAQARPSPKPAADLLQLKDLPRIRQVMEVAQSPTGDHTAYVLRVPRVPLSEDDGAPHTELHVLDRDGAPQPFITGKNAVRAVAWTHDGEAVTFLAKRRGDDNTDLYRIPLSGGEARKALDHKGGVQSYHWHPQGKQVVFTAKHPLSKDQKNLKKKGFKAQIFEEDLRPVRLWVAKVQATDHKSSRTPIKADEAREIELEGSVSSPRWSPDGSRIAVAVAPTPLVDDQYMNRKILLLDAETGKEEVRVDVPGKLSAFRWSPDGKHLALTAGADRYDSSPGRLLLADAKTGQFRNLLPDLDGDVQSVGWKDASTLSLIKQQSTHAYLATISIEEGAKIEVQPEPLPFVAWRYHFAKDGKSAAAGGSRADHASEVYTVDLQTGAATRRTDHNPWLKDIRKGKQETISYKAKDGLEIQGMLIHPVARKKDQRVPLIVAVHGGPESHISDGWLTWYSVPGQVLAGRGFAVFYPNYRGSTGRGLLYSKGDYGDPAGKEFDDILDGVDYLVSTGLVDKKRVGITGGSYGGYASAWGATFHSRRYAASVAFVGVTNLVSKAGTTEITQEMKLVHFGKYPWDDWKLFLERSPIFHAKGSTTPTLILHGEDDTRVDAGQSQELYRHLKIRGKAPVRLVLYPGEGHGNRKAAARLDYSVRMLRWMEHYLKGSGGDAPPYDIDYDKVLGKEGDKNNAKGK